MITIAKVGVIIPVAPAVIFRKFIRDKSDRHDNENNPQ
jgi:hypothetical protein